MCKICHPQPKFQATIHQRIKPHCLSYSLTHDKARLKYLFSFPQDFEKEKEVIFPPSISSFPAIDSGDQLESIKEESLTDILSATELGELKGTSNKQIEQEEVPSDAKRENLLGKYS